MESLTLKDTKTIEPPRDFNSHDQVSSELLAGYTIVLTGVMELIGREKLETFINTHGGRTTGSVSGKTTHVIHGVKLEDGREVTQGAKYRTALDKGTPILSESQFEQLVRNLSGN